MSSEFLVTMIGMAIILYATRIGGLLIARRLPTSSTLEVWLGQLPGVTLIALVAPAIAREGWIGAVAAGAVWLTIRFNGSILIAMGIGVAIVALQRHVG